MQMLFSVFAEMNNVVIGSAPSSGSTLLVNLIGKSPYFFQCGELSIFDKRDWILDAHKYGWRDFQRLKSRGYRRRMGCEMSAQFTNLDINSIVSPDPGVSKTYLSHCMALMDHLAVGAGRARWVEKTPANIFAIWDIQRMYPQYDFVVIVRDPRSVLLSLSKRGFGPGLAAARWYLSNLLAYRLRESGRVTLLRYEDLVSSPEETLFELGQKIGLVDTSDLLKKEGSDSIRLQSWQVSATNAPSKEGLWNDGRALPDVYWAALSKIRASKLFAVEHGIVNPMTALDLARAFGYKLDVPAISDRSSVNLRALFAGEYSRYLAAMLKRGYAPRPVPFQFAWKDAG